MRPLDERLRTRVLVVGGGPVGTTLAMDLAWRGIDVMVAGAARGADEPPSVKCNHVAARTMEMFRRLGVAQQVRDAGLPADYANDIAFRTTFVGHRVRAHPHSLPARSLHRDGRPGQLVADAGTAASDQPDFSGAGAGGARAGDARDSRIRPSDQGARIHPVGRRRADAKHEDLDTGERLLIDSDYLVGCDGAPFADPPGRSAQRLTGDALVQRTQSTYIRAPALLGMMQAEPAWSTPVAEPSAQRQHVRRSTGGRPG